MIDLRTVLHQEAVHARKFVSLRRQNDYVEVEIRKVSARELETARVVGIVNINDTRHLVGDPLFERLD
jgi:hypothetical protein